MEQPEGEIQTGKLELEVKPYEIKTLVVYFY
jgi:hypothetical protein